MALLLVFSWKMRCAPRGLGFKEFDLAFDLVFAFDLGDRHLGGGLPDLALPSLGHAQGGDRRVLHRTVRPRVLSKHAAHNLLSDDRLRLAVPVFQPDGGHADILRAFRGLQVHTDIRGGNCGKTARHFRNSGHDADDPVSHGLRHPTGVSQSVHHNPPIMHNGRRTPPYVNTLRHCLGFSGYASFCVVASRHLQRSSRMRALLKSSSSDSRRTWSSSVPLTRSRCLSAHHISCHVAHRFSGSDSSNWRCRRMIAARTFIRRWIRTEPYRLA